MNKTPQLVKGALLLALVLTAQSLRFIIPLPPFVTIFVIGSLVNALLFLALLLTNWQMACLIGVIAPLIAFSQGQLPVLPFIPLVATGNLALISVGKFLPQRNIYLTAFMAALSKASVLYFGTKIILSLVDLPAGVSTAITFALSWPQLVTSFSGVLLAQLLLNRLKASG